jgi:hypothetical protein
MAEQAPCQLTMAKQAIVHIEKQGNSGISPPDQVHNK